MQTSESKDNQVSSLVKETTEKLKGMTYSNAMLVLKYVKRELELNLTLN
jgi:hypothetical protein